MMSYLNKLYPWRYPVAIVTTGLTFLARAGLQPVLGERGRVVLFTLAVTLSAMNGGFGPGLLATALSMILAAFAIFEPRGWLALAETANLLTLGLFALVGVSISGMSGELHKTRRRVEAGFRRSDEQNLKLKEEIAQRQQIESTLRESEERFKAFMDHSPAIAFMKDQDGRYVYANRGWEQLNTVDWRGKTDDELFPGEMVREFHDTDREVLETRISRERTTRVVDRQDGLPHHRWVSKFPVVDSAGRTFVGGVMLDITERRKTEESLREMNVALTNAMPGIARLDTDGRYITVNDMYAGMLGFDPAELIGIDWSRTIHLEDRPHALAAYERMIEIGKGEFEARGVRKDGSTVFQQVLIVKIVDDAGRHIGDHCFMRDISERKAAEQALRDSKSRLREISDAIPGAVYQYQLYADGSQRFLSVSDGIGALIGHSAAAVVNDFALLWDAVCPEDQEALSNSILRSAQTMMPWEFEGRIRSSDGSVKWIRGHSVPEPRREDGSIVWNGILTDVTERKRNELEISRLAAIVENSGDAIISRDLDFKITTWNAAAERLFGYTAAEVVGKRTDILVPPDRFAVVAQRRSIIHQGIQPRSVDTVWLRRGNRRIDVAVTQSPIKDAGGKVVGVSLSVRDITERKRTEAALRESEEQFRAAFEVSSVGMSQRELATGRMMCVNRRLCEMTGYAQDELLKLTVSDITYPEDRAADFEKLHSLVNGEIPAYSLEKRYIRKDGGVIWGEVTVSLMRDGHGEPVRTIAVIQEITERKQAEQTLRASERSIRRLYEITNAGHLSFDERLRALLAFGCERFRIPYGFLTSVKGEELEITFAHAPDGAFAEGTKTPLSAAFCSSTMQASDPICYEHVGASEWRTHPGYLALGMECYMGTKIVVDEQIYGTLCFLGAVPHVGRFADADRDFLKLMAVWISGELDRYQSHEQLQKSHGQIRQIIDTDPNFIFARDCEGRYTLVNKALADAYGTTVENLIGKTDADFNSNGAEVEYYRKMDLEVMDTLQEMFIPEQTFTDASGRQHWLQTVKRPVLDETGCATQVLGASTDITARKRTERRELSRRDVLEQLAKGAPLSTLLLSIVTLVEQEAEEASCSILLLDESKRRLFLGAGPKLPNFYNEAIHGIEIGLGVGSCGTAAATGQRVIVEDIESHPYWTDYRELATKAGLRSCWSEPIISSTGQIQGTFAIYHPTVKGPSPADLETIGIAANLASIAIERKQAEDALRAAHDELEARVVERTAALTAANGLVRASEERLQHALAVGKMGSWERDLRTSKITWDDHTYDIFGIRAGTDVDRDLFLAHVDPDHVAAVRKAHEIAVRTGAGYDYDFRFNRPDGRTVWIHANGGLRHDRNGTPTHVAGINFDITERKTAEEALRNLNEQLDRRVAQRTQELAESRAGLRGLVGELTMTEERERRRLAVELHDTLAQSLAVANMYLWRVRELLGERVNDASMKEVLGNLDRTVDDSITYTRSLISELSPPVLYDLGLPAAFRWLAEQMGRHGLRAEVDGPAEGFSLAQDDAVFLFQCARELLWNVVKHGATDRATVAYGRDGNRVSLAVADQGKGFDLQTEPANGDGGSHFGLFSIRERVALRGGTIEINAAPGAGTWVSIVIPIERTEPASAKMAQPILLPSASALALGDAIRIVIADDHKMLRQGLRRVLEEQGSFTVVGEAGDGAQAVALARAVKPQVVIMDVNMPTMNGIIATEQIISERPSTIVIGLSFGTEDYVVRAMQAAGAATCLAKERAVEDVSRAILEAVEARRGVTAPSKAPSAATP